MSQIRYGLWETNSSSTHTLSIYRKHDNIPETITIDKNATFGWEWGVHSDVDSKASYLYLMYVGCSKESNYDISKSDTKEWKFIEAILRGAGVKNIEYIESNDTYGGYIDHGNELSDLYNKMLQQPDLILGFLFNDKSIISTGNDNSDDDYGTVDNDADVIYCKGN